MKHPKTKPRDEELKSYGRDIEYQGKKYGLEVNDKVSNVDGVVESHFNYTPHFRPGGSKSRRNFAVGMCLPTCKAVCCRGKKRK